MVIMQMKLIKLIALSECRSCGKILIIIGLLLGLITPAFADESEVDKTEPWWGIAFGYRFARIPYPSSEQQVADVIPLLFYENKYVFIRGLTGGIKVYTKDQWQFSFVGRYPLSIFILGFHFNQASS